MKDDEQTVEELSALFSAGDAWLRKYGMVTSIQHNAIVLNIYSAFPKVRYLEYFLPEDGSRKKVWVRLYVPFWKLLFTNRDRMVDDVILFLREYLTDYDVKVELKRYKKGVEKSNEVPDLAVEHVAPELRPAEPPTPEQAPAGGAAPGDDPVGPQAAQPGDGDQQPVPGSSDPGDSKPSI